MQATRRLKFNPYFVRAEFRRTVCGELMLPSGKPSGYFLYPVEDDFVQNIAEMYEAPTKSVLDACGADNVHEWLLWTSARIKYGYNYLAKKKNQFFVDPSMYEPAHEPDRFEEERIKMTNLVENKLDWVAETLVNKGLDETAKKAKNILRECLTSDFDGV